MSAVLLLEKLNLLQFLQADKQVKGSDEAMQTLKRAAVENRHVIKNYLNVTISEKLTPVAMAQAISYAGRSEITRQD